jgi:polysaccharide export outer membrane protein
VASAFRSNGMVLRQVHTLLNAGAVGDLSDVELLRRFTTAAGEAAALAFAELVERHGPMVLRVCRSVVRDEHDALDAFQATFLVLVRRAGTLRVGETVAPWLHEVAVRTARGARRAAARRRGHERKVAETSVRPAFQECPSTEDRHELAEALHDEIGRLPSGFRDAVVLCGLEGLTQEHAARRLGWPLGTLQSRLARGRARLRERLERRGVGPAALAFGGFSEFVPTPLTELLREAAVQTALATATRSAIGQAACSGMVPGSALALAEEVSRAMLVTKLKTTAALAALGALTIGGVALATAASGPLDGSVKTGNPAHTVSSDAAAKQITVTVAKPAPVKVSDTIFVEVLEALPGRPLTGPRKVRSDGTISLGYYGNLKVAGLNRDEIKVAVIERMLKYLPDEVLGLEEIDPETEKTVKVPPLESNRVYVNDEVEVEKTAQDTPAERLDALEQRLQELTAAIRSLQRTTTAPSTDSSSEQSRSVASPAISGNTAVADPNTNANTATARSSTSPPATTGQRTASATGSSRSPGQSRSGSPLAPTRSTAPNTNANSTPALASTSPPAITSDDPLLSSSGRWYPLVSELPAKLEEAGRLLLAEHEAAEAAMSDLRASIAARKDDKSEIGKLESELLEKRWAALHMLSLNAMETQKVLDEYLKARNEIVKRVRLQTLKDPAGAQPPATTPRQRR